MYVTWYFAIAAYPFLTSDSVARRSYSSVGQFYWLCYLFLDTFRCWTRFSFSLSSEVKRSLGAYSFKSSDSAHGYIVMVQSINIMTVKVIRMTFKVILSSVRKKKATCTFTISLSARKL